MEFPNLTNNSFINKRDATAMTIIMPLIIPLVNRELDLDCLGRIPTPTLMKSSLIQAAVTMIRLKLIEWESPYFVSNYETLEEVKEDLDYDKYKEFLGKKGISFEVIWNAYNLDDYITTNLL